MGAYLRRVRGFGRDIRLFLLYNLLAYVGFGVFQLLYNLYLYRLGLREDFIGAFNGVQTLAMAGASATMGPVLARTGVWRAIVGGFALFLVVSLALAFAEARGVLLVLSALLGVGLAYLFTSTMPFIIEWGRRDLRADIAAIAFSLISLATTIGSLLGGALPALVGRLAGGGPDGVAAYRWTLVAGTVLATAGLAPLLAMGPARRSRPRHDHAAACEDEDPAIRRQVRKDMGVFIAVGGLMALGAGMVMPFYNVYLTTLGANARSVGYVYAVGGLAAAVIGLTAPALAARVGSLRAVLWVRLSVVPAYLLLLVVPSYGVAVVAHLVRQTSISMGWPLDSTFIAEVLPARARASVFGLRSAAWNLAFSGASLVGGAIIVRAGYGWTFASLVVFTSLGVGLFVGYFGAHPMVRSGAVPSALPRGRRTRVDVAAATPGGGGEDAAATRPDGPAPTSPTPANARPAK
ncbi:MAG: hypothetical protein AVDCRST_MAG49-3176 [uncultured Thermomicrobiales bacterium]|uniref:Major facilitator superfamily (MFS) profile domain-containing protein n=1 Tax=uncultured Thermomicrobiales bacterium TaxID=1645740 RepID=A0A6J4V6L4_9BACT|nr:MAG: hypothetical protein AVDCRST_MAG49-3176 [uncultured Thermomicrobiales bacterium]